MRLLFAVVLIFAACGDDGPSAEEHRDAACSHYVAWMTEQELERFSERGLAEFAAAVAAAQRAAELDGTYAPMAAQLDYYGDAAQHSPEERPYPFDGTDVTRAVCRPELEAAGLER